MPLPKVGTATVSIPFSFIQPRCRRPVIDQTGMGAITWDETNIHVTSRDDTSDPR